MVGIDKKVATYEKKAGFEKYQAKLISIGE